MEERPTDSQQSPDSFELVLVKLWHQEFNAESDRAAVILGASKLDQLLRELLVKKFLPNPTSQDDLFDSDKPIASFSSRINVAYRLGLIDNKKGEGGQEGISHYGSLKDYLLVVVYLVQILTCSSKFLQLYRAHFL